MNSKPILLSKTFWINLVTVLSTFYPPIGVWVKENPALFVQALGAANILVRLVTKGKVTLWKSNGIPMVMAVCAVSCMLMATSCTIAVDPSTGKPRVSVDPESATQIADKITERINKEISDAK